jgi:hypothetical protein
MKKKNYLLSGLIVILAMGFFFYFREALSRSSMSVIESTTDKKVASVQEQTGAQVIIPVNSPKKMRPSITSGELKSLHNSLPDKLKVQEEFRNNPHTTPESLNKFAKKMGPLMERALKNGDDAGVLINELRDCAYDESVALSARALCVSNCENLGKAHPEMKEKSGEIRANVSLDVQKLLNDKDKFINN